jgi:very-short-patch-repair endonuclease
MNDRDAADPALNRLKDVLNGWRSSLLDMGGRNRLLNFVHTRSATLEITSPRADAVLSGLGKGWAFAPVHEDTDGEPAPARPAAGLVTQKTRQAALDTALRQLRRKSGQMYNDYGLWVLWLGVGMLEWREPGAKESSCAPLVLVPVELRPDAAGRPRLHPAEHQERMHNAAMEAKAARLGADWSPVTDADLTDPAAVLAAAEQVCAGRDGWAVRHRVVLGLFSSYKEAMYQDLQQNEDRILAHPLVRAVALGPDAGPPPDTLGFEPPDLERIDEIQLPEQTPLVLDADASQRQCIAAALDGRSFVMSGPPGTGKSQTITNMIAALMHSGRSVLFVSEKAAALDVVRNRLRSVGLGDFVLALHSGDTTKKAVATELARVLTTEARVTGASAHELDRARRLRTELSAHAAAMNEIRQPLERSLHDVLGRLVALEQAGTPQVTLSQAGADAGAARIQGLGAGALRELLTAAEAVSRAWRPAAEGEEFAWRGVVGSAPTAVVAEAAEALDSLHTAVERRPFAAAQPRTAHDVERLVSGLRDVLGSPDGPAPGAPLPDDPTADLARLARHIGARVPGTAEAAAALFELTALATAPHRPPHPWFDPRALDEARAATAELRELFADLAQARAAAADVFGEQVADADELPGLAARFAEQHRGIKSRLFSAEYKADRAAVARLTRDGTWHRSLAARLGQALAWHTAARALAAAAERHRGLLGRYLPRTDGDFAALDEALATAGRIAGLADAVDDRDALASHLADGTETDPVPGLLADGARSALAAWCTVTAERTGRWSAAVGKVLDLFEASRGARLSPALLGPLEDARHTVDLLRADAGGPEEWRVFQGGMAVLAQYHADTVVSRAAERGIPPEQVPATVEYALLRAWADGVLATDTRLATTRSADLDARVADFREADRRLVAAAAGAVIEACNRRRPRRFGGGAAAVITRQAELKRRHMPVRDLLARTGEVVRTIKPCFMMSPLTVSQFLPADYDFDVVIFDEASQVRPADAVNCIYRGRALIVAGDDNQLPPTSFFDSAVEEDDDEYDDSVPDSFASLLQACKAGAMIDLPLRWHYRSRHEDLITFSNRSFYRNSMVTFPGAVDHGDHVGVSFHLAKGTYDRGGRRDNRAEAETVAQRVIHHFDTRPDRTLGVVALSQAQATAIDQAVQQARLLRPDLDDRFTEGRLDGFFIKNLESVQGDERDVMIMSIGYGPDAHGRLGLNFGPINKDGGWRRLNVAVTRARCRMEVVASFRGGDLDDSPNESVRHLKRYLEYAERGPAVLAEAPAAADAETESPFEESVLRVLRGWGHTVQPQVGVAGYRVDLGLRHPDAPGTYALGIECDGRMYHSSKTARDRDRLREEVLVRLGWRLHRIWGTDWYRNRTVAEQRLREAVEAALAGPPPNAGAAVADPAAAPEPHERPESRHHLEQRLPAPRPSEPHPADPHPAEPHPSERHPSEPSAAPEAPRTGDAPGQTPAPAAPAHGSLPVDHERVPVDTEAERPWSAPYEVCTVHVTPAHDLHTPEARPDLRRLLAQVIETEGPIHEDLLVQRAREAWGVTRAGARIRENIRHVVHALVESGHATLDGDFADTAARPQLKARRPAAGVTRKATQIAPAERRLLLRELAAECPAMSHTELLRQACDYFGWRRIGPDIRTTLERDLTALFTDGTLTGDHNRITVAR